MKQVVQDFKDGKIKIINTPFPVVENGYIIVKNINSVISVGTEKRTVDTGKKNLLGKARARPDLVKKVLDNVKKEGIMPTLKKVKSKLSEYKLLGYSSAGIVVDVPEGERNFSIGDRVACGGGDYAVHGEVIKVPVNLCTKIPDNVEFEEAAFATLGAIALQGVRQSQTDIGNRVGVIGLGLMGILTVQLLKAKGCKVFGIDTNINAVKNVYGFGIDIATTMSDNDLELKVKEFTDGFGLDNVIITASTSSNGPIALCPKILRDRGRITVVGNVAMSLDWEPYYHKELSLNLSRSYGPGRYDLLYEERGIDYPIGYVRWTEQRNMQTIVELIAERKLNIKDFITHRFSIDNAIQAYETILEGKEKILGVVIQYNEDIQEKTKRVFINKGNKTDKLVVGVIGAGSFGKSYILPPLKKHDKVYLKGIATSKGANAMNTANRFGFEYASADYNEIINDKDINTVFILTRHNLHAKFVIDVLKNNKNVFVEKPLGMTIEEIEKIEKILEKSNNYLMVGFNRRFSPHTKKIKEFINSDNLIINYRINAGALEDGHWLMDKEFGGGRIIGEGCHFIDLVRYIADSEIEGVNVKSVYEKDNKVMLISFKNGSIGTVSYITTGDKTYPKERIEIFGEGKIAIIDDFRKSIMSVNGKRKEFKSSSQDKGHSAEVNAFINSILNNEDNPIPKEQLIEVSKWTIQSDK